MLRGPVFFAALAFAASALAGSAPPGIAILHNVDWRAGDTVRDGAGEFAVFLRAAQLQRDHRAAGLIAVGDRHGMLRSGGERALRRLVFTGLAIAKLAPGGTVAPADPDLFLDGAHLAPDTAAAVLARCLARHGSPPRAVDPELPTSAEIAAIRAHLQPFQAALALAAAESVAQR